MQMRKIQTKNNHFWANFFTAILSFGIVFIFVAAFTTPAFYTSDDSQKLPELLEQSPPNGILGVSSENENNLYGCNEEKPVIGWIDFSGKKVIKEILPDGETASACFKDLKAAKDEGFLE